MSASISELLARARGFLGGAGEATLIGQLANALEELVGGDNFTGWEYATAIQEEDGTLYDYLPHSNLNNGSRTPDEVWALIDGNPARMNIVIVRRPIRPDWEIVPRSDAS